MILYIGEKQESFFVDDVANEIGEEMEVLTGYLNIKEILAPSTTATYKHIIVNVLVFINEVSEIVSTLKSIKQITNANLVIYARGSQPNSQIVQGCYYAGFKNYILSNILSDMKEECRKGLNGYYELNGVPFENSFYNEEQREEEKSITLEQIRMAQKRKISVGVAGGCSRIGTTTQSLQMCKYLMLLGYQACYIEMNSSSYIKALMDTRSEEDYQCLDEIGLVKYQGIDLYIKPEYIPTIKKKDYDYFIYDYGCFHDASVLDYNYNFLEKDIHIIICGIKPIEYEGTASVLEKTKGSDFCYIFSFVEKGSDREEIKDLMDTKSEQTFFAEPVFNPFSYSANSNTTYENIFNVGIKPKEITQEVKEKRKGFFTKKKKRKGVESTVT